MSRDASAPLFSDSDLPECPDDHREECSRETRALAAAVPELRIFSEFRRKAALFEVLNRAFQSLAEALRFSGRITVCFHQGKITKVALKEAYYRKAPAR